MLSLLHRLYNLDTIIQRYNIWYASDTVHCTLNGSGFYGPLTELLLKVFIGIGLCIGAQLNWNRKRQSQCMFHIV